MLYIVHVQQETAYWFNVVRMLKHLYLNLPLNHFKQSPFFTFWNVYLKISSALIKIANEAELEKKAQN